MGLSMSNLLPTGKAHSNIGKLPSVGQG